MKQSIFFILFIFSALQIQAQCEKPNTEVCLNFTANQIANNPLVPTNLVDVFKGEIAAKVSVEIGVAVVGTATGVVAGAPSGFLGSLLVGGGMLGAAGAANSNSWGANYGINTWAPYFKYGITSKNKSVGQSLAVNVDVLKVPNNHDDRFIVIGAQSAFNGNNEYTDGRDILRSKYVDQYTFSVKPLKQDKDQPRCVFMKSIPETNNKETGFNHSFSWSINGSVQADPSGSSVGGGISYTVSSATGYKDFEINNRPEGQVAQWFYNMKKSYVDGVAQQYNVNNPNDIVVNGALTKWLKTPADLALGQNNLDMISLYKIGVNDDEPVEFEFESVMRVMHAEVIGRWGAAPYLSGIAVVVPSFCVLKGIITVDPDPANPAKTTITKKITDSKYYTLSDYMDMQNTPLPTLTPPIIPGGCYAIKNVNRNKYITHGGGAGIVNYYADRDATQQHEKINLVYRGKKPNESKDLYAMYSQDGRFISASNIGGAVFKSEHCNDSELWEIESAGNNKHYIRSYAYNRWLSANNNWFGQLGTSENKSDWEVWTFETQSGGCVTSPLTSLPSASYNNSNTLTKPTPLPLSDESTSFFVGAGSGSPTNTTTNVLSPTQLTMLAQRAQSFTPQTNIATLGNITQNLQAMTIEAWVKNDGGAENIQAIVSSANLDFAHLQASDDANVKCAVYVNTGEVYLPPVPKSTGNWQHVAMVVQSGNSQLYINGVPHGPKSTKAFSSIKPATNVLIGKGFGNGRPFNGKIANVRIWNRALPPTELTNVAGSFNLNDGPGLVYHSPTTNVLNITSANDCLAVPAAVTSGLQSLTIEAWVNNSSPQTDIQAVVSATGPEFVHLQLSADGNVKNAIYLADGRSLMLPVIPKLTPGWHHVAMVVESGNSRVYLDGKQVGASDPTTFSGIKPASSVFIGKGWSGGRVFNGQIADVRIWKNRPLTQSQLETYRHTPPPANATGLAFYR